MSIPAVVSLVTLGVDDVERATAFYERLGWPLSPASVTGEVSFFATAGGRLALWSSAALAADARVSASGPGGYRGVALAINVASAAAVDEALDVAQAAGGSICKPGQATEWGGYTGYFADPDGNLWEVAHNPFWPLDADGLPQLP